MRRKMKKIVVVIALLASLLVPAQAQAAETKFTGAPLTNLDSQGATINIMLLGVPAKGGLYIQECVEAPVGTRPTLCNSAIQLWISYARGASFSPTDVIKFKPTGTFVSGTTNVDCTVSKCGIFLRFDHTVPGELSEDQFIPLTFKATTSTSVALPVDEITATINGVAVSTQAPITLGYRQRSTVSAVSKAGATLTFASLDPNCALNGREITPLKAVGECAISVTSAGNEKATGRPVILPIRLTLGVHTLGEFALPETAKAFSKTPLPTTSNFGEKIKYKAMGACSVVRSQLTLRRGKCEINATAVGRKALYVALSTRIVITGK
jgi:hypothetical protein